jgi:hypothetical protein
MGRECSTNGKMGNAYRFFVGEPERKRPLGRSTSKWEDNIKMDLIKMEWGVVDWIHLSVDKNQWNLAIKTIYTPDDDPVRGRNMLRF